MPGSLHILEGTPSHRFSRKDTDSREATIDPDSVASDIRTFNSQKLSDLILDNLGYSNAGHRIASFIRGLNMSGAYFLNLNLNGIAVLSEDNPEVATTLRRLQGVKPPSAGPSSNYRQRRASIDSIFPALSLEFQRIKELASQISEPPSGLSNNSDYDPDDPPDFLLTDSDEDVQTESQHHDKVNEPQFVEGRSVAHSHTTSNDEEVPASSDTNASTSIIEDSTSGISAERGRGGEESAQPQAQGPEDQGSAPESRSMPEGGSVAQTSSTTQPANDEPPVSSSSGAGASTSPREDEVKGSDSDSDSDSSDEGTGVSPSSDHMHDESESEPLKGKEVSDSSSEPSRSQGHTLTLQVPQGQNQHRPDSSSLGEASTSESSSIGHLQASSPREMDHDTQVPLSVNTSISESKPIIPNQTESSDTRNGDKVSSGSGDLQEETKPSPSPQDAPQIQFNPDPPSNRDHATSNTDNSSSSSKSSPDSESPLGSLSNSPQSSPFRLIHPDSNLPTTHAPDGGLGRDIIIGVQPPASPASAPQAGGSESVPVDDSDRSLNDFAVIFGPEAADGELNEGNDSDLESVEIKIEIDPASDSDLEERSSSEHYSSPSGDDDTEEEEEDEDEMRSVRISEVEGELVEGDEPLDVAQQGRDERGVQSLTSDASDSELADDHHDNCGPASDEEESLHQSTSYTDGSETASTDLSLLQLGITSAIASSSAHVHTYPIYILEQLTPNVGSLQSTTSLSRILFPTPHPGHDNQLGLGLQESGHAGSIQPSHRITGAGGISEFLGNQNQAEEIYGQTSIEGHHDTSSRFGSPSHPSSRSRSHSRTLHHSSDSSSDDSSFPISNTNTETISTPYELPTLFFPQTNLIEELGHFTRSTQSPDPKNSPPCPTPPSNSTSHNPSARRSTLIPNGILWAPLESRLEPSPRANIDSRPIPRATQRVRFQKTYVDESVQTSDSNLNTNSKETEEIERLKKAIHRLQKEAKAAESKELAQQKGLMARLFPCSTASAGTTSKGKGRSTRNEEVEDVGVGPHLRPVLLMK